MESHEHLPTVSKSICDYLELLFTPEFYRGFSPKNYPPYNIIRVSGGTPQICGESLYRIDVAVAGFTDADIAIELDSNNTLVISAAKVKGKLDNTNYIHRGISNRAFQLKFKLSQDVVVVTDDVTLVDGILSVTMKRKDPNPSRVIIKNRSASRKATVKTK